MPGPGFRPPDAEAAYRLLAVAEELGRLGTWDLDLATGGMVWSEGLFRILDIEPDDDARPTDAVLDFIHPKDRAPLGELLRSMQEEPESYPDGVVTHDYRVVRSDGAVAEVQARGRLVRDDEDRPVRWVGSIQDVSGQRRGERLLRARTEVTQALRDWESFDEGLVDLLRRTAQALGFPIASLWLWDAEAGALLCRAAWHAADLDVTRYEVVEREIAIRPGEGPPGRAWEQRRPVVAPDLTAEARSPLIDAALETGVRSGTALPLLTDDHDLGVVALCGLERRFPDEAALDAFSAAGREIGAFLERRLGALGPAPLTPRELEVLKLAADGLSGPAIARRLVVSPSTVKTHFENIYEKLGVTDRASAVALGLRTGLLA